MAVLVVHRFFQFWHDNGNLLTGEFLVVLVLESLDEFNLILLEDDIIEDKLIDGVIDLSEQLLNFLPRHNEVLMDHLLEIGPLFDVRISIQTNDVSDLLQSYDIMHPFVLLMKTDAPLGLANGGFVAAGETGTQLDHLGLVDVAEMLLV